MIVFRLCRSKYKNDLSGIGAQKSGGRWNSKGTSMIYTSETRALCTAEIAVHTPLGIIPADYCLVTIDIPDGVRIYTLGTDSLPEDWNQFPYPDVIQKTGDAFIREEKYAAIKVPSAVVQGEFNYLLNPAHKDMKKIKVIRIETFRFDERLFRK